MRHIITPKILIPLSLVIAMIPGIVWLLETRARCDIIANDVVQLQQERSYLRTRLDQITGSLSKIETSIGVIEHEIRTR